MRPRELSGGNGLYPRESNDSKKVTFVKEKMHR